MKECPRCQNQVEAETPFCAYCRFPLLPVAGKYKLIQELEEGGFGEIYLAHHIHLTRDKERVIKVLGRDVITSQEKKLRFQREVELTSTLSRRNEHIVRVYDDFGKDPHLGYFYVMEYLEGQTLKELIQTEGALSLSLALHLFEQLCRAMQAAHKEGVVHRDLKPQNLLLIQRGDEPKYLKVIDFGIARPILEAKDADLTRGILGTPAYMAPEQCLNQTIDTRTDIYAMGVILYEMLAGVSPFAQYEGQPNALIQAHLYESPPPIHQHLRERKLPDALEKSVAKALAKSPEYRHPTVQAFWEAIDAYSDAGKTVAYVSKSSQPSSGSLPVLSTKRPPVGLRNEWQNTNMLLTPPEGVDAFTPSPPSMVPSSTVSVPKPKPVPAAHRLLPTGADLDFKPVAKQRTQAVLSPTQRVRRFRTLWIALGVLLTLFTVGGYLYYKKTPPKSGVAASSQTVATRLNRQKDIPQKRTTGRLKKPTTPHALRVQAFVCKEGTRKSCYSGPSGTVGKGSCRRGQMTCSGGRWSPCQGVILPRKEECNGRDDDCDGRVDEEVSKVGQSCLFQEGSCKAKGRWRCHRRQMECFVEERLTRSFLRLKFSPSRVRWTLRYRRQKLRVQGSFCLGRGQRRTFEIRLDRRGYDTCRVVIPAQHSHVQLRMLKTKAGELPRNPNYCLQ